MRILGLTGSIGVGKSLVSSFFRTLGVPVLDADKIVHDLLTYDGPVKKEIAQVWPQVLTEGNIDRVSLGKVVFSNPEALYRLEAILHPRVFQCMRKMLKKRLHHPVVVLDIPLLFEVSAEKYCDAVVMVDATSFIQRSRVLRRPHMTLEKYKSILLRQMDPLKKRRKADFVLRTGGHKGALFLSVKALMMEFQTIPSTTWAPQWKKSEKLSWIRKQRG